jgi:hypothetical protein
MIATKPPAKDEEPPTTLPAAPVKVATAEELVADPLAPPAEPALDIIAVSVAVAVAVPLPLPALALAPALPLVLIAALLPLLLLLLDPFILTKLAHVSLVVFRL